jgi:hypothetical protein
MRKFMLTLCVAMIALLTSCSDSEYLNVIPSGCQAVISFDLIGMAKAAHLSDASKANALKALLHINDPSDCGVDITSKVYLFESPDGSLGLVAKVSDDDDIEAYFNKLSSTGICKKVTKEKGFKWTVLRENWVIGFSSKAVLVMGPVIGGAQGELKRTMARYLNADEEDGIKETPLYDKLDSLNSDVAMVASVTALPEKIGTPFRLGAPADADPADVMIAATMDTSNGCLNITGTPFSFNGDVDRALKNATASYKPITGKFIPSISEKSIVAVLMNFDGTKYINLLRSDKGLRALLAGLNTVVDADMMIKSINGDVAIAVNSISGEKMTYTMASQLKSTAFLDDVSYWKKSLPSGAKLTDNGPNGYHLSNDSWNLFFGVKDNNMLYVSTDNNLIPTIGKPVANHLSTSVMNNIKGKRLCIIINMGAMAEDKPVVKTVMGMLKPIFGDFKNIIYSIK